MMMSIAAHHFRSVSEGIRIEIDGKFCALINSIKQSTHERQRPPMNKFLCCCCGHRNELIVDSNSS
jgi:hypothetical protein